MPEIATNSNPEIPVETDENVSFSTENENCVDPICKENDQIYKKKPPLNFRTEMLKGLHSPSDVLSPFSQKISSERNSALKNFKPKSLMDKLLTSQLTEKATAGKQEQSGLNGESKLSNETNLSESESDQEYQDS